MKWEVVIGLETHAQLSTASKIFSGASTAFGAAPNTQASAVDIALPGVLPVLNRGAVERAIRFGLAVGGTINPRSVFARKNYFYPDLPKGYQISQYEIPVVQGGSVAIVSPTRGEMRVQLTRAHLEEDAGKSLHEDFHGMTGIDLNRAGTPLLEIVSEPDMRSSDEAVAYAKTLHALVRWIGICDGNMQEGSFRCDANVSVRRCGSDKLGTRCEIKNLNSFRFMQEAIEFEVRRQIELIEDGGTVVQETRLYDPDRRETRSMRSKEDAQDYRYFPDPDLPPLVIDEAWIERVKSADAGVAGGDAGAVRARLRAARARRRRADAPTARSRDYFEARRARPRRRSRSSSPTGCWAKSRRRSIAAEIDIAQSPVGAGARRACCSASPTARSPARSRRTCSTRCGRAKGDADAIIAAQGPAPDLRRRRDRDDRRRRDRGERGDRRRVPRRQGKGVQLAGRQGDGRVEGQGQSGAGQRDPQAQALLT